MVLRLGHIAPTFPIHRSFVNLTQTFQVMRINRKSFLIIFHYLGMSFDNTYEGEEVISDGADYRGKGEKCVYG